MFEELDAHDHENGSEERYHARIKKHEDAYGDRQRHLIWWIVHNAIAHPMIAFMPFTFAFRFHDWTSAKINVREGSK